jgi:hypothetical protein
MNDVGALRPGLIATLLAAVVGCASPAPKAAKPLQAEPPPPKPVDPSYDWRGLPPAPFGSYLKEVPLALHEVLLFRDDAAGAGTPDDAECYGTDTPAPRFLGGTPDEYLVCFKQDRLARIRASVSVSTEQAPEIFATACALWLKNAAASTQSAAPAAAPTNASPPPALNTNVCEGQDGAVHFTGRLGDAPAPDTAAANTPAADTHEHEVPSSSAPAVDAATPDTQVSILLDGTADPKSLSE